MNEPSGLDKSLDWLGDLVSSSHISTAADVATVLAAVGALIAAVIALRQLKSQAESQSLTAILATNDLWRDVAKVQQQVTLSAETVDRIVTLYDDVGATSVLLGAGGRPLTARVPYVLGALLPAVSIDAQMAPRSASAYRQDLLNRTMAFGYVLNHLPLSRGEHDDVPDQCVEDAKVIETAMEVWVSQLNEIAELYGHGVINRRFFVGKRHIAIALQAFFAEPYIMWRNSTYSGRWGLRILQLGEEARAFHWHDEHQSKPVMARMDPEGYERTETYEGFRFRVGWMFGEAADEAGPLRSRRKGLGFAFAEENRTELDALLSQVPQDPRIVSDQQGSITTWDVVTETDVLRAVKSLNRTPGVPNAVGPNPGPAATT